MSNKPTIRDVATRAGVSLGTVSKALNGDPTVSDVNRQKVREAVKGLRYTRLRRSGPSSGEGLAGLSVAMVLLGLDQSLSRLPVIAQAVDGVERALAERNATMILVNAPVPEDVLSMLRRAKPDALVIKAALTEHLIRDWPRTVLPPLEYGPVVWLVGRPDGVSGDSVTTDDFAIGYLAAGHLVEMNHRRLAVVYPKADHLLFRRRAASFEYHARAAGAEVKHFVGGPDPWAMPLQAVQDVTAVEQIVDDLLAVPDRPTAVFCPADSIAAAVYRTLQERGVAVGSELSIVSVNNDLPLISYLHPRLTTIDVFSAAIGRMAVSQLAWRHRHGKGFPDLETSLMPKLVMGESVARR